jgi:hypothetical protein
MVALVLTGSASGVDIRPLAKATGPDVVTAAGTAKIRIGDTSADLQSEHGMVQGPGDCAPRLPDQPAASPVLHDDRLVLLWASPPLHTPEGVGVGSAVSTLEQAYPDGTRLTAEQDYGFDGLLVPAGDHAYLFLHDQTIVQKLIVGSAEHAVLLFRDGFGTC